MLSNCGSGEDSWESLGLQGYQTSQRKSTLHIHCKDWCWSWNSNTLATSGEELTHWKRPWCWEGLVAGEGDNRGWDGWMASLTRWTWVWAKSKRQWWTGRPGVLWFMGSQRVGHDWATELNWMNINSTTNIKLGFDQQPDLISAGESHGTAHLESQLGKGLRQHVYSVGET